MARPLRIEYPGALYHVISRGNSYQNIFLDDRDRRAFLKNLKHCIELHNLICHAYCQMDNHYHILIETPDGNLSKAMRDINGNYTQKFHTHHGTVGHILQGRYKAYLIEKDAYFLEVARYIVNNPVKAKIVEDPGEWRWSSYGATIGGSYKPNWLEVDITHGLFSQNKHEAQKKFAEFVRDGIDLDLPYKELKNDFILGSDRFVNWIWDKYANGSENNRELPRSQRVVGRPALDDIFHGEMMSDEMHLAIKFARIRCGYLISEIANHIGFNPSTVGKIARDKYNK